ncbi:hypothetical protein GGD61_008162 [Bradyrhizobium sp. SBR1B]|nr:hypothetical protein [Bradyrhizobium sp. SBR1B]
MDPNNFDPANVTAWSQAQLAGLGEHQEGHEALAGC